MRKLNFCNLKVFIELTKLILARAERTKQENNVTIKISKSEKKPIKNCCKT